MSKALCTNCLLTLITMCQSISLQTSLQFVRIVKLIEQLQCQQFSELTSFLEDAYHVYLWFVNFICNLIHFSHNAKAILDLTTQLKCISGTRKYIFSDYTDICEHFPQIACHTYNYEVHTFWIIINGKWDSFVLWGTHLHSSWSRNITRVGLILLNIQLVLMLGYQPFNWKMLSTD